MITPVIGQCRVLIICFGQHIYVQVGGWVAGTGTGDNNREEIEPAVGINSYLFNKSLKILKWRVLKHHHVTLGSLYHFNLYCCWQALLKESSSGYLYLYPTWKETRMCLSPWIEVNSSCPLVISVTVGVAPGLWEVRFTVSKQLSASSQ